MSVGASEKIQLYLASKPDYTSEQVGFIVAAVVGAKTGGFTLEVKSDADLGDKQKAGLVPFVQVPGADLFLFNAEGLLAFVCKSGDNMEMIKNFVRGFVGEVELDETRYQAHKADLEAASIAPLARRKAYVSPGIEYEYDWEQIRLPVEGRKNTLITAALPYVNNVPHLGNIIGAVLSADVYARYCRQRGDQVVYVCGTDEYGTATETKALEEGLSCADICAKYFKLHASVYEWFQIRFDHFGRTTNAYQTPITHDIFQKLYANGYFFEEGVDQTFCEACDRFLADRYVEGVCPLCGFGDARGDQCDGCGKLINCTDLKEPKCKMCKSRPVIKRSQHLFLDLGKLQGKVEGFVGEAEGKGTWSANSASIAKAWLTEGLRPRCYTRDLKWGTPVPVPGFESKVFYVWFDAPIGYISITAEYTKGQWEAWWKKKEGGAEVSLTQFMGKDNVPFHTVTFPATILGTEDSFILLDRISTTEYLNYESGKFSKSRGTGVFGTGARDSGIPAALWRYYLLATRPESMDASFSWDDFASKCNAELLANLGNLVNRTSKFLWSKLEGRIGAVLPADDPALTAMMTKVQESLTAYVDAMDGIHLRAALREAMAVSAACNQFLTEAKLDGKLLASDPELCRAVLSTALNVVYLLSALLEPFLPSTSTDILAILNAPARRIPRPGFDVSEGLLPGHEIRQPFHLFHKLEEASLADLRLRFSGKQ